MLSILGFPSHPCTAVVMVLPFSFKKQSSLVTRSIYTCCAGMTFFFLVNSLFACNPRRSCEIMYSSFPDLRPRSGGPLQAQDFSLNSYRLAGRATLR